MSNDITFPNKVISVDFRKATFNGRNLIDVIFEKCDLREASFDNCNLENAQFIKCDLRGTNFSTANMYGVKLTGSVYTSKPVESQEEQDRQDKKTREILGW